MNAPGHNTEDCLALRHKVQDLTESEAIAVSPPVSPNVGINPLPVHRARPSGPAVNMIFTDNFSEIHHSLLALLVPGYGFVWKEATSQWLHP